MGKFEEEIDEMFGGSIGGEEEEVEVGSEVEPETGTSEELDEETSSPASDEDSSAEDEVEEPEEPDETTALRTQNAALLERLSALESQAVKPAGATGSPVATELSTAVPAKPRFLAETDDVDDILSDREKLEGLLQRVYEHARNDALPQEYRNLPSFLGEQVQKQMVLREGINEFFSENSDLLAVRRTVGALANEVVAEHPDWNLGQVLKESETRTRSLLGIKKTAVAPSRNPALAKKGSARKKTGDVRSPMQKELDELIDL